MCADPLGTAVASGHPIIATRVSRLGAVDVGVDATSAELVTSGAFFLGTVPPFFFTIACPSSRRSSIAASATRKVELE